LIIEQCDQGSNNGRLIDDRGLGFSRLRGLRRAALSRSSTRIPRCNARKDPESTGRSNPNGGHRVLEGSNQTMYCIAKSVGFGPRLGCERAHVAQGLSRGTADIGILIR
jgi:hypothetical protein